MKPGFVTVLLTTYNGDEYLVEQLDSIVQQTYKDLEIIICDDASKDQTRKIIEKYKNQDSRIKVIFNNTNIGLHANLSNGFKISTGEYIAISDQDDVWKKDKIEKLLACLGKKSAVYSNSLLIDHEGNSLGISVLDCIRVKCPDQHHNLTGLFSKNCVSAHALLFRRELLNIFLPFRKDIIFDHQIAFAAALLNGLSFCQDPLVYHRIHGKNHTNSNLVVRKKKRLSSDVRRQKKRSRLRGRIGSIIDAYERILANNYCPAKVNEDLMNRFQNIYSLLEYKSNKRFHWKLFLSMLLLHYKHAEYSRHFNFKKSIAAARNFRAFE